MKAVTVAARSPSSLMAATSNTITMKAMTVVARSPSSLIAAMAATMKSITISLPSKLHLLRSASTPSEQQPPYPSRSVVAPIGEPISFDWQAIQLR
ncbi:hypothetical protein ACLOJK_013409 [Asimina triloba]